MPIRLLVADDHEVVRKGLRTFLSFDTDLELVGEARDGREAVEMAGRLKPDVVVMDLMMPEMDGIAATAAIRRDYPEIEVIALTSVLEGASVADAVRAGAIGYLLKNSTPEDLHRGIRAAAAGQVFLSPEAAARLVRQVKAPERPEPLTPREIEVLRLVARGRANKQIARDLGVGEETVKTHVRNILGKLQAASRTQAALHAIRTGLVSSTMQVM
ncbi:MAG TPA: response regulator transcription factor [Candidatus Dormibacteraeota bacterium]